MHHSLYNINFTWFHAQAMKILAYGFVWHLWWQSDLSDFLGWRVLIQSQDVYMQFDMYVHLFAMASLLVLALQAGDLIIHCNWLKCLLVFLQLFEFLGPEGLEMISTLLQHRMAIVTSLLAAPQDRHSYPSGRVFLLYLQLLCPSLCFRLLFLLCSKDHTLHLMELLSILTV